jgi:hypothetical protein
VRIIHGVIDLGIQNSVKEVPRFFRRIQYRIGSFVFTPDDMEHGILRENHRFPNFLLRPFGRNDPRAEFVVRQVDPRIHFALVCASSSCPPVEVYTAENLDRDLTVSGKTFLNAGGCKIDRESNTVYLSRVFKWYAEDFGETDIDRLHFIAPYLYREEDRRFLKRHAEGIHVKYLPYDWRLNRT